ncbi:hypothetical protein Tco_0314944, partial [Tanacetum coccineum]
MSRPIVRKTARMTYSHAVKENWGSAVKTLAGSKGYISGKGQEHDVVAQSKPLSPTPPPIPTPTPPPIPTPTPPPIPTTSP